MDFDGHDDQEEELGGLPVGGSGYSSPPRPPAPPSRAGVKMGGSGGGAGEQGTASGGGGVGQLGSGHRKASGGGGSDGGGRYRECLKNHAVGIGGHAVDGCGEFMPAGEEGTLDALKCAACNCHRNFHRKEVDGGVGGMSLMAIGEGGGIGRGFGHHGQFSSPYYRTPGGYLHHHHVAASGHHPALAPPPLALHSTSGGGGTSRDEQEDMSNPMAMGMVGSAGGASTSSGKKRFRTKFTQEQKDRMLAFAERVGWRIQKHDEAVVQQFCSEAGVKRHVLKVWMHNNKHTLGKKP